MKKIFLSLMVMAGIYGLAFGQQGSQSSASADDPNWEKIGEKTVDLSMDRGIFDWNTDREKSVNASEKYSAIKFKAKDATVNLTNVEVEFDDGKKQDLNINSPVQVNSESKVLTLNNQSELDKITFNFKKDETARDDKAKIEVWGLKSQSSGMGQRNTDTDRQRSTKSSGDRSGASQGSTQSGSDRSGMGQGSTGTSTGTDRQSSGQSQPESQRTR